MYFYVAHKEVLLNSTWIMEGRSNGDKLRSM